MSVEGMDALSGEDDPRDAGTAFTAATPVAPAAGAAGHCRPMYRSIIVPNCDSVTPRITSMEPLARMRST
jgi:hypothetical protein